VEEELQYAIQFLWYIMSKSPYSNDKQQTVQHLSSLGIGHTNFDETFIKSFYPEYTGLLRNWNDVCKSDSTSYRPDISVIIMLYFQSRLPKSRFFETGVGYFGLYSPKVIPGDLVYVIRGCESPVIPRKVDDYFVHVATCFVSGLMEGEAATLVKSGEKKSRICVYAELIHILSIIVKWNRLTSSFQYFTTFSAEQT